jgi:radical SAM protein with 4Fe4S-binding SPASM domain
LDENRQNNLLKSGLDTVIFSIDGCTKNTHEDIRKGVNFDRVVANAANIIKKRNQGDYDTRFVFRFIRQKVNKAEWDGFRDYWSGLITTDKNDIIICYDVHSWGGERTGFGEETKEKLDVSAATCCHHVFDRLIVLWDGTVALCCSDLHHGRYSIGNVRDASPIEIFNNEKMNRIRELHKTGLKDNIEICKKCSILYSESAQEVIK